MSRRPASQHGLTLIELLISMVIGLVIIAGVGQVYLSNKTSYSVQERLGDLQENGRFAMYFLQRDIRMAGFPLRNSNVAAFCYQADSTRGCPDAATISKDGGGSVSDQIVVTFVAAGAGNTCLGNAYAANDIVTTIYSINVDTPTGVSRLMCEPRINGTALAGQGTQPIVDGIENMQILYGVDTTISPGVEDLGKGDGYAEYYVPANLVTAQQWSDGRVVAVRVSILASTISSITSDTATDTGSTFVLQDAPAVGPLANGVRGRVFTSTIEIRNRTSSS